MTSATSFDSHGHLLKMQPSGNIKLDSSTSGAVKWKAREVSATRDFPKSFQLAATHITNPSEDQSMDSVDAVTVKQDPTSTGVELFEHNVGSQEKVVQVEKAVLKPHKVEPEEVKPRVDPEKVEPVILGTENIELASSTSGSVKWKAQEVSAAHDFTKSFQPAAMHITNPPEDQSMDSVDSVKVQQDPTSNGVELLQHNFGSQDKVVQIEKVIFKPHKVEPEEVKLRVDSEKVEPFIMDTELPIGLVEAANHLKVVDSENTEYGPLRIRLYPSPKRRKVSVFRDFPVALEQFGRQVDREINKPSISEDENVSEESLLCGELGFPDDLEVEFDRLESEHVFHDLPMALEQVGGQMDQEINKPLVLEDDIESDESLMNTEVLSFLGDLKVESNRLESVVVHDQDKTVQQESIDLTDSRSSTVVNVPRRRVSGVRCFPPGCGRDAACLNKEDLEKVLADHKNDCLSCKICADEEEPFVEEEGEQEDEEVVVVEEVMEEEEEDEMVEEEEKEEEVMMTDDKGRTMEAKFERQRVVVIALKAPRSPWILNARAKPTAGGELKEKEEVGTTEHKEDQRVIVQALMASTRCPWRNSRRGKRH